MNLKQIHVTAITLFITDGASLIAAMALAYYVWTRGTGFPYEPGFFTGHWYPAAVMLAVWIGIHFLVRLYDPETLRSGVDEYVQVFKASAFGMVVMTMLSSWDLTLIAPRGWIRLWWVLSPCFLSAGRFAIRRTMLQNWRRGRFRTRAIVVGVNHRAINIARQFNEKAPAGTDVIAFLDDSLPPGTEVMKGISVWGSPLHLLEAVGAMNVGEVLIVSEALDWETFQELMRKTVHLPDNVPARLCPNFDELFATAVSLGKKADIPLLTLSGMRMDYRAAALKSVTDFLIAAFLLLCLAPVFALVAALIRLVDGTPVFDRTRVFGRQGKAFDTIKFHTGLLGKSRRTFGRSPSPTHSFGSGSNGIGQILYRTGLDKLPQLLNVLTGQMSLVGPRSVDLDDSHTHRNWLPTIAALRPGLTGPWVLTSPVDLEDEMQGTVYYVRNWSFGRDLVILAYTAFRIILARGALRGAYELAVECPPKPASLPVSVARARLRLN